MSQNQKFHIILNAKMASILWNMIIAYTHKYMTHELVRLNNVCSNSSLTHAECNFFINWLPFPSEIPELSLCLPGLAFLPSFLSADPSVILKLFLYYKRYICCLYRGIYKTLLYTSTRCMKSPGTLRLMQSEEQQTLVEYGSCCRHSI